MLYEKLQELVEEVLPPFLFYELDIDEMLTDTFVIRIRWGDHYWSARYEISDIEVWPHCRAFSRSIEHPKVCSGIEDAIQKMKWRMVRVEHMLWKYMSGVPDPSVKVREIESFVKTYQMYIDPKPPHEGWAYGPIVTIPLKRYLLRDSVVFIGGSVKHSQIVFYRDKPFPLDVLDY